MKDRMCLRLRDSRCCRGRHTAVCVSQSRVLAEALLEASVVRASGMPDDIVKRLDEAFAGAMRQPAFINGMKELRLTAVYRNNKEFSEYVAHNYEIFGKLLKELGLYTVKVQLHQSITADLKVWVVPTATDEDGKP